LKSVCNTKASTATYCALVIKSTFASLHFKRKQKNQNTLLTVTCTKLFFKLSLFFITIFLLVLRTDKNPKIEWLLTLDSVSSVVGTSNIV